MKITSSKKVIKADRRDDIIRQRDEYESNYNRLKAQRESESRSYQSALAEVSDPIKKEIESALSRFDKLSVRVTVDPWGVWRSKKPINVRIEVNEDRKFEDDSALSWDFRVQLDNDGNVLKETGSWSGLKATTPDQIESLRQTLGALEYLNNIDWRPLLDKALPEMEDYYKTSVPDRRDRPNFEQMLAEVDLEELVGSGKAVKVKNWESSGWRGEYVWVQLIRETPSGYIGRVRADWDKNDIRTWLRRAIDENLATQRIRKSTVKPVTPLEVLDPAD